MVLGKTKKLIPLRKMANVPTNIVPIPKGYIIDSMYSQKTVNGKDLSLSSAKVANFIYSRYEPYITDSKQLVIAAITIMASKITKEEQIDLSGIDDISSILRIERDICRKLNFILC
jgi:hypothetical protein